MVKQVKQDGGRDVVGQIAHHAQGLRTQASGQCRDVNFEHIRFMHRQLLVLAQPYRQIAV